MIALGRFSAMFYKINNVSDFLLAFLHTKCPMKTGLPKRTELTLFRVDPFSEKGNNNFDRDASPDSESIPLEVGKSNA